MTAPVTAPALPAPFAADAPVTKSGTPLVKLALSRAKRKGGVLDWLATSTGHRVAVGLRENGHHTGSWTFRRMRGGPRHIVTLDHNAHKSVSKTTSRYPKTAEQWLAYFAAIVRHEVHHGLHTERDLFRVNRECMAHDVPFSALNIAEDHRIDEIARKSHGEYRWDFYYQPETADDVHMTEPLAYFVWDKLCESKWTRIVRFTPKWQGAKTVERIRLGKPDGRGQRDAQDVLREFVTEFKAAVDTMSLVPILRDVFLTFPAAERDVTKIGGLPSGVIGHGYSYNGGGMKQPNAGDVVAVDGEVRTADPVSLPPHVAADVAYFLGGNADGALWKIFASGMYPADGVDIEPKTAAQSRQVAARMAGLLGAVGGPVTRIATSGNRLHVSGVMTGDAGAFRTSNTRGERPKVVVLFDQSGSMSSDWRNHGAAFLGAMLTLHQQGRMDVTCVLTGDHRHAIVPPNFPVQHTIRFCCNGGCESVDKTLEAVKPQLRAADIVLIYTDGNLTDGNVDAARWRSHGVDLIGVAVAASGYAKAMRVPALKKHFGRGIIADNGAELATKIVQYIAARTR